MYLHVYTTIHLTSGRDVTQRVLACTAQRGHNGPFIGAFHPSGAPLSSTRVKRHAASKCHILLASAAILTARRLPL